MIAASADGGTFGQLQGLALVVRDGADHPLLRFDITDASVESAFLFGEVYRRGEQWKFRAVGQGYASGLYGIATDFGITVDDPPPPSHVDSRTQPPLVVQPLQRRRHPGGSCCGARAASCGHA